MALLSSVDSLVSAELARLDGRDERRKLRTLSAFTTAARIEVGGHRLINFSSNNYLGYAEHPRLRAAAERALKHWGVGAGSSRLIAGSTDLHARLEKSIAEFLGTEAALLFPSGYMANLGVITALAGPGDAVLLDRLVHASLIDAVRLSGARLLVFRHADAEDAARVLKRASRFRRLLLVSDSLFSMDGDFAPVEALASIGREADAITILDEAHALGVWGPEGRGLAASNVPWDVLVGTLSKSFGSQGGFVAGSRALIDLLINRSRSFIYTTALSPICVAAAQEALTMSQEAATERAHVQRLSTLLRNGLAEAGWDTLQSASQIVPVRVGATAVALALAKRLEAGGIYAPAIRPPTVHPGHSRLRFSVTAAHAVEDIQQLLQVIGKQELAEVGGTNE